MYNAHLHKTAYYYNKGHRPVKIAKYLGSRKLYSTENYIWNEGEALVEALNKNEKSPAFIEGFHIILIEYLKKNGKLVETKNLPSKDLIKKVYKKKKLIGQIGNLLGKYKADGAGKIYHGLFFYYDAQGDITEEQFLGNLSGTNPRFIQLNEQKPVENGVESYKKNYTYSDDSLHLLLSEREDNRRKVL